MAIGEGELCLCFLLYSIDIPFKTDFLAPTGGLLSLLIGKRCTIFKYPKSLVFSFKLLALMKLTYLKAYNNLHSKTKIVFFGLNNF